MSTPSSTVIQPPAASIERAAAPRALRWFNAAGRGLAGDAGGWPSLQPERLIEKAQRDTGLHDWGSEEFRPALNRLCESLRDEARLNLMGRLMLRSNLLRQLSNRLKMQRDWTRNPSILKQSIRRPLFIVGLPRTGSTLLQRLLARDPNVRSLQTWEMMLPSPPPTEATYLSDPRIAEVDRKLAILRWAAPEFIVAHEVAAGEPEECVSLLQTTLVTHTWELWCRMPRYIDWVDTQDIRQSYQLYRKELQLLQSSFERDHWVLKSPFHLFGLEAILEMFPDAAIIQTHREPKAVVPSLCSLFSVMHQLTSDHASRQETGKRLMDRLAKANDRAIELRQKDADERFFDVSFRHMIEDPLGVVRRIYDRFGYVLEPAAEAAMLDWLRSNPQHKHGVHRYTLDEFGLDSNDVERRFAQYRERFAAYL